MAKKFNSVSVSYALKGSDPVEIVTVERSTSDKGQNPLKPESAEKISNLLYTVLDCKEIAKDLVFYRSLFSKENALILPKANRVQSDEIVSLLLTGSDINATTRAFLPDQISSFLDFISTLAEVQTATDEI
jgi:hypothetical protein